MFSCFLSYWLQHSFFRITFNTSLLGAFPLSIFNHIFDKISKPLWWSRKHCDAVRCPDGRWWPGPGCRNDLTKCIPVITYSGWKLQAIMQWSLGWCWASGTVEPLWWICWLAEALKELIRALSLVISFTFLLSVQFRSTEYCPTYDHFSRLWMFLFEVQHSQSISRTHIHCMLPMPCGHMERPNLASLTLYYTFTGVIKFPLKQCKCIVIWGICHWCIVWVGNANSLVLLTWRKQEAHQKRGDPVVHSIVILLSGWRPTIFQQQLRCPRLTSLGNQNVCFHKCVHGPKKPTFERRTYDSLGPVLQALVIPQGQQPKVIVDIVLHKFLF